MKHRLTADLIGFINDNQAALGDIHDDQTLQAAARYMVDSRLTATRIMVRVRESSNPSLVINEVLCAATSMASETRMQEILLAFCAIKASVWYELDVILDIDTLLTSLQEQHGLIEWLLANHVNDQIKEGSPLYLEHGAVCDDYWAKRVRRYVATSDFHRAWDELCKAHRGIASKSTIIAAIKRREQFEIISRFFIASTGLVGQLAMELHDQMVDANILPPLSPASHTIFGDSISSTSYAIRASARKPRTLSTTIDRPGLRIASHFLDKHATDVAREADADDNKWWRKSINDTPYVYLTPGIAIIAIALHFHACENDKKRAKHDAAVATYMAGLTTTP